MSNPHCAHSLSQPSVSLIHSLPTSICVQVQDEFDVLHIKKLPSFEGLTPRYTELLLQYLTVPYLRVPLVLSLFADPVCSPCDCLLTHSSLKKKKHKNMFHLPPHFFCSLRGCYFVLVLLHSFDF